MSFISFRKQISFVWQGTQAHRRENLADVLQETEAGLHVVFMVLCLSMLQGGVPFLYYCCPVKLKPYHFPYGTPFKQTVPYCLGETAHRPDKSCQLISYKQLPAQRHIVRVLRAHTTGVCRQHHT